MTNEVTIFKGQALTAREIRAQVNLIQEVMKAVMLEGVHYGKIPGCDKPSLFKPGSEKLLSTFGIAVVPRVEDLSTADEAKFRVYCQGTNNGILIGEGLGEASSMEEKYKWRRAVCEQEWNETPEDRRREKWVKAYQKDPYQIKQVRTQIADVANTVLKMAKKRAQIDMTLTSTAASDIFTQDIEDLPPEVAEGIVDGALAGKPPVKMPEEKAPAKPSTSVTCCLKCGTEGPVNKAGLCDMCAAVQPEAAPAAQTTDSQTAQAQKTLSPADRKRFSYISEAQEKRLYAIAKQHGLNASEVKAEVWKSFSIEHCYQIPWKQYDAVIEHVKGFGNA